MRKMRLSCGASHYVFIMEINMKRKNFKKRMKTFISGAVIFLSIASVSTVLSYSLVKAEDSVQAISSNDDYEYTDENLPVYREKLTDETLKIRKYDDQADILFVSFSDFYKLITGEKPEVKPLGDYKYEITTEYASAVIDTDKDTLSTDNFGDFTSINWVMGYDLNVSYYRGSRYLEPVSKEVSTPAKESVISFRGFDIPVRSDGRDVYMPLTTLSDMFADTSYNCVACNGEKIYVNKGFSKPYYESDDDFARPFTNAEKRNISLISYEYNELQFVFKYFYSYPSTEPLSDLLKEKGLKSALEEQGYASYVASGLFYENDYGKSMYAYTALNDAFKDCNTLFFAAPYMYGIPKESDIYKSWFDMENEYVFEEAMGYKNSIGSEYIQQRSEKIGKGYYFEKGDTAHIIIDDLNYNEEAWENYYEKGTGLPGEADNDTLGIFKAALDKAKSNPAIKNVILDFSGNRGKNLDVCLACLSLIKGDISLRSKHELTGEISNNNYKFDRNFDGKFDHDDDAISYDFNYAVLTGEYTYAGGNLFALLAKEAEIPIIGTTSGGGASPAEIHSTVNGFRYELSSASMKAVDKNGNDIDSGISVDIALPVLDDDYKSFFDIEANGVLVKNYYEAHKSPTVTPTPAPKATAVPVAAPTVKPDPKVKKPVRATINLIKNKKKRIMVVRWDEINDATGYELMYARNKKFTKGVVSENMYRTSFKSKKLKKRKTYYVRVRAYKITSVRKKVYGRWSKKRKIKIYK